MQGSNSQNAVCSKTILTKLYTSLSVLRKDPLIFHSRRHPTTQRVLDKFHTTPLRTPQISRHLCQSPPSLQPSYLGDVCP